MTRPTLYSIARGRGSARPWRLLRLRRTGGWEAVSTYTTEELAALAAKRFGFVPYNQQQEGSRRV